MGSVTHSLREHRVVLGKCPHPILLPNFRANRCSFQGADADIRTISDQNLVNKGNPTLKRRPEPKDKILVAPVGNVSIAIEQGAVPCARRANIKPHPLCRAQRGGVAQKERRLAWKAAGDSPSRLVDLFEARVQQEGVRAVERFTNPDGALWQRYIIGRRRYHIVSCDPSHACIDMRGNPKVVWIPVQLDMVGAGISCHRGPDDVERPVRGCIIRNEDSDRIPFLGERRLDRFGGIGLLVIGQEKKGCTQN